MIKDYFSLSLQNLRRRKLRAWLTMIGIIIGIAAVVSLISLGNGLKTAVLGQFSSLSVDTLTVTNAETGFGPPGSTAIKKLTEHDLKLVESVPGIKIVIPRLLRVASIKFNDAVKYNYVVSMPQDKSKLDFIYTTFGVKAESGSLLGANDKGKVLLGSDYIDMDFDGKKLRVGDKLIIQGKNFEVIGFLKKSGTFQLNIAIMMLDDDIKEVLKIRDEWDFIAVRVQNKDNLEQVASKISDKLRKDRNEKVGEEDFSVQTPAKMLSSVTTILNIVNIIVSGIAAISLIIGGIGIANTMYTSVLERTREIGTMKAVGAKNRDILWIFLIESGMLGLVGGIIGTSLGMGFAFLVGYAGDVAFGQHILEVTISWTLLLGALAFSFVLGIAAGTLPAIQASKLNPTEALRK
jgi:putative ABC transport system permease protein